MRVVRWTALFLRPEGRRDSAPLFEGWVGCSAVGAAWLVQHFALLPDKGGILFPKRIPPLEPPEKGEGRPPRPPHIAGLQFEGLHALRSVGAVYVASPRVSAFRYRQQPRPTPWGASDVYSAADCLRSGGIASLAARWGDGADSRKHLRGDCGIALLAAAFRVLLTYRFLRPFVGR